MLKLICLVSMFAAAAAGPWTSFFLESDERIFGGRNASIEEVPYQVSLQYYGYHTCGGSIISREWIVTAGHCVSGKAHKYTIRSGSNFTDAGGAVHNVSKIVRHGDYSVDVNGHPMNDVSLVRVTQPFEFNRSRRAARLFDMGEESPPNSVSTISGWGKTEHGSAPILQIVNIPIISKAACYEKYKNFGGIPDGQICAAFPHGGKDSCQGDSGGPLTIGGRLAGIVSWGHGCALAGNPGVYTEVAAYRAWIKSKAKV